MKHLKGKKNGKNKKMKYVSVRAYPKRDGHIHLSDDLILSYSCLLCLHN